MSEIKFPDSDGLRRTYQTYKKQKCFVAYSHNSSWRPVIVKICKEVLAQPNFGLEPWFADEHFNSTATLRNKVVEMIANARYGIYDISYWRKDEKGSWEMPRNVLIELGMAIALNRPALLLRHIDNRMHGLELPKSLESVTVHEFQGGKKSLREVLEANLPEWGRRSPDQDWKDIYCIFGCLQCRYRAIHPLVQQLGQEKLNCHISDGDDPDQPDFRNAVEEILGRIKEVTFEYLTSRPTPIGYNFRLCSQCQVVRSTPFAIYRITPHTSAETFLAIGMSIALETQFGYTIPKVLLTGHPQDVPSLLSGYEVVVTSNEDETTSRLLQFIPEVLLQVRQIAWKPRPLPEEAVSPQTPILTFQEAEASKGHTSQGVIQVFTPKGEMKYLPQGATPIDFAYSIHTDVGNYCADAVVNGESGNLYRPLQTGDQVEIIISDRPDSGPKLDWLNYAITTQAAKSIRRWLAQNRRSEVAERGRMLLDAELQPFGWSSTDAPVQQLLTKLALKEALKGKEELKGVEDLLVSIGVGRQKASKVVSNLGSMHLRPVRSVNSEPGEEPVSFQDFTLIVQINGKIRDRLEIAAGTSPAEIRNIALSNLRFTHFSGAPKPSG